MKGIDPTLLTDAMVLSVKGNGAALVETVPAWNAPTAYALLQQATYQHRIYERRVAGTTPDTPLADTANWRDVSATNPRAMFDLTQNTPTAAVSPLEIRIAPGRINALYLQGVQADHITVTMSSGAEVVYSHAEGLDDSIISNWHDYFLAPFEPKTTLTRLDLPPYTDGVLTITLTATTTGTVNCGYLVVGDAADLGQVQYGAGRDLMDFSLIERDRFGGLRLMPGKNIPKTSQQLVVARAEVRRVVRKLESMTGRPCVWLGIEADSDAYFDALAVLGILRRATLNIAYHALSYYDLDIEGM